VNVPDELISLATGAGDAYALEHDHETFDWDEYRRAMLAAVLDRHEAMVLERASERLMTRAEEYADASTGPRATWRRALQAAARHILHEPTPLQVVESIADGTAFVVRCPSLDEETARGDSAPDTGVIITYADETEREQSRLLAEARQQLASEGTLGMCPPWAELTGVERVMATVEARNWLRAARRCGLITEGRS
jgi:hypothetical protein